MRLLEEFEATCREFPAFRAAVAKARDLAPDPGTRQQLDHALHSLDQTFADFKSSFPKAADAVQARFQEAQDMTNRAQQRLDKLKEELAAKQAAAAAAKAAAPVPVPEEIPLPPVPPELPPMDFQVGLKLRDELLKRFGIHAPAVKKRPDREIWEDWSESSS